MITGATQQQMQTTLAAISASKGNNSGQNLLLSISRAEAATTDSVVANFETARSLSDVARKYDVQNMSPREMAAMSQGLYKSGAISFQDHALLSFQTELGPEFNNAFSGSSSNPDAPRDFIAKWEAQLKIHEKLGDDNSAKNDKRILNILGNLAALRESAKEGNRDVHNKLRNKKAF